MPHSERIKSAYLRSTALCVAVGCAVPGAMELDGRVARKPKYAKISRMESVCHGAAISRRGVGVGACICAGVGGSSFMRSPQRRYTKIWIDTQARAEKLQRGVCDELSGPAPRAVILNPRKRVKDLSSISIASRARDRREIPACGRQASSLRSSG